MPAFFPISILWSRDGGTLYEPLLWAVNEVLACSKHRRRLESSCPGCKHEQNPLLSTTRPGYCGLCQTWLGDSIDGFNDDAFAGDELNQQLWIAETVGELLEAISKICSEQNQHTAEMHKA